MTGNLIAYENELTEKLLQNGGRYEMRLIDKDTYLTEIYLLDKENGIIWATQRFRGTFGPWVKLSPMQDSE